MLAANPPAVRHTNGELKNLLMRTPSSIRTQQVILATILTALIPSIQVSADALPDSSLQFRNIRQQQFAVEYVRANEPLVGFKSDADVLSFIDGLAEAWSQEMADQSDAYRRLNSYVPMWTLYGVLKTPIDNSAKCLVWQRHAVPSFVADLRLMADSKDLVDSGQSAFLIRVSNLTWAITPSFECELEPWEWASLRKSVTDYPIVVQQFLDNQSYTVAGSENADGYRDSFMRAQRWARLAGPVMELEDLIYAGRLSEAAAAVEAALPDGGSWLYAFAGLGLRLVEKLSQFGDTELAMNVLDALVTNTAQETVSRAALRDLYEQVDSRAGAARFEAINTSVSTLLEASDARADITDLLANTSRLKGMELPLRNGRLILLDFWSVSCGPCIEEIPALRELAKSFEDQLLLISINSDLRSGMTESALAKFIIENGIDYPVVFDSNAARIMEKFGVFGWPTRFLVDELDNFLIQPAEQRTKLSLDEVRMYLGGM